jgi:glycerol-3-phosphate cytidylyltransferase
MAKTVITYGTFDMFHIGHLRLLQRAAKMGDRLIVGVSTDEFNLKKGKRTLIPYDHRKEIVQAIKGVDTVIPETSWEQKREDIRRFNVDTLVMGGDWEGHFDALKDLCKVIYLPRTKEISTTDLKKSLINFASVPREDILKAFEVIEILKREFE